MKNKKIITLFTGVLALIVIALVVLVVYDSVKEKREHQYNLYFLNSANNVLDIEQREISNANGKEELVARVIEELKNGPKNTSLVNMLSEEVAITDYTYSTNQKNEGVVDVDLSEGYNNLSEGKRLLCIGAVVYTLTDLEPVDKVYLTVNGEPIKNFAGKDIKMLSRDNVVNNPLINPDKINIKSVVLYFKDSEGYLQDEERSIEVKQSLTLEYQIVEQLIVGPAVEDLTATVPSETKIRDIKTEDGICYVNLSSEFVSKSGSETASELSAVYSIVNSLTELDTVEKVQFLIEGEKLNDFNGHFDFSKTFSRNNQMIADR